jgi:hypothetical protein
MVPSTAPIELDDRTLRARLEDTTLPPSAFGHRAHLRVAWSYLAEEDDFAVAAARFRRALLGYATSLGATSKYHETITWVYLALVREAMDGRSDDDANAFLAANPALLDHGASGGGALATVLDVKAVLADPLARRILVLPRRHSHQSARIADGGVCVHTSGS